jgi:hypothetical protein
MMKSLVAIHQPNFFPWLGYFHKLRHADRFVLLDTVQFQKTSGNWGNRAKLLVAGAPRWFTMPVVRSYHGFRSFREMRISPDGGWRDDFLKTIQSNYGRSEHFHADFPALAALVQNPTDILSDYNACAIGAIARRLGIDGTRIVLASELGVTGQGSDLLIELTRAAGGTAYLCGGGSGGYLEPEKFARAGIGLLFQRFCHPQYLQGTGKPFVAGLSCIDALMHRGFAGVAAMLEGTAFSAAA